MKKIVYVFLVLSLLVGCCLGVASCKEEKGEKQTIVYLGDSIAEGILGPSPISERPYYSYYGIIGKINDYYYYNRSVSGHQTTNMLAFLDQGDTGAVMVETRIREADIIHVSMLGNDLLQNNFGDMIIDIANGDYTAVDEQLAKSRVTFARIVEKIKELNPDALLFFQTVYNPVYDGTPLIVEEVLNELSAMGSDTDDNRILGAAMLTRLNAIIFDYLEEHEGAYYVVDAFEVFNDVYVANKDHLKSLIYADGVHPSNIGHAIIAEELQRQLVELGMSDAKTALKNYKELRNDQLTRLYSDTELNVKAVKKQINKQKDMRGVTEVYFKAINGYLPHYAKEA